MHNLPIVRAAQEAAYHRLRWRYDQMHSLLDDHYFVREASCLLAEIHASLRSDELPDDLVAAYRHLERDMHARMLQRQMLPGRPLF